MPETITVIALLQAKAGKETETEQVLRGLVGPTRTEQGCIAYDLYARPDARGCFMFIETWQTRTHLNVHLKQPRVQELIRRSGELLEGPMQVSLWEKDPGS